MVEIQRSPRKAAWQFVLKPNQSISWNATLGIYASLLLTCWAVAIGLAWIGFWLVLPFAGLEMLALGGCLYLVARRCSRREVIWVDSSGVRIERGMRVPNERRWLPRDWTRVVLEAQERDWLPSRLLIRSHGQCEEIGEFLNETERRELAASLARALRS